MANVKPKQFNAQVQKQQPMQPNVVSYVVDGQEIVLSDMDVLNMILDKKTASLVQPYEVIYFLQQCKAQKLNPFVRDAWLIKYDASSPAQIVTSEASLEKRADDFEEFEGMEAGVIVYNEQTGEIEERIGTLVVKEAGEILVGGWAQVYRKDRKTPIKSTVSLNEYDTGKSTWKAKPATMIRKVAKAMALREAFPKHNSNLYDSDEIGDRQREMIYPDAPGQIGYSAGQIEHTVQPNSSEPLERLDFAKIVEATSDDLFAD